MALAPRREPLLCPIPWCSQIPLLTSPSPHQGSLSIQSRIEQGKRFGGRQPEFKFSFHPWLNWEALDKSLKVSKLPFPWWHNGTPDIKVDPFWSQ